MQQTILTRVQKYRAARTPFILAKNLTNGAHELWFAGAGKKPVSEDFVQNALYQDQARSVEIAGQIWFCTIFNPPLRLVIIGAVHIAQFLIEFARKLDFSPILIDPRTAFATKERFPGIELNHAWPDEALAGISLDHRCAIVTLTHDPKIDDPALHMAMQSKAFYIGCLGSTRTHAKRLDRFCQAGFDKEALGRLHAPIGLAIFAKGPAEIALAIMAQIIQSLRQQRFPA